VGAGGRLFDTGGRLLCGEGGPLDGPDVAGTGASEAGTEPLGCAQTALPGAPDAGLAQPAVDSAPPPASTTTSANNPRVRTPTPLPRSSGRSLSIAGRQGDQLADVRVGLGLRGDGLVGQVGAAEHQPRAGNRGTP
jgi:hypothetical protein